MAYKTLVLDHAASVAILTLNRPEKRNALSREMMAELHLALDEIASGAARVLIITGAGESFCAGMDLSALREMVSVRRSAESVSAKPEQRDLENSQQIAGLFRHLHEFPKPAIAAVNGYAVAGGCGIATMCDFTLAAPEAKFGYTEVRVGFMPAFVAAFLVRQIGEKRARDLLLTGRVIDAIEAERLGLVNEIVPGGRLHARALELGAQLAALSPTSLRFTKRLLGDFFQTELERDLTLAVDASARIRATPDFEEGLSAFLEKRPPQWRP